MEFFRIRKDIPFMRHALVFNIISLITFILAVILLATKGLHLGVEFTGGTVMEINYGPFESVLDLPPGYDLSQAKAAYLNGFLRIDVPVAQRSSESSKVPIVEGNQLL